jgi:ABC-type transport system involved in multi-copper enzyme maturation permease subunit
VTALVRSELLKVRTVRSWWAYLVVIVLLAGIATVGELGPSGRPLDSVDFQVSLFDAVGIAALIGIILGITMVTSEFRHGTITPTTLVEPHRGRVLAAKALGAGLVGLSFALLALAVIAGVVAVWLTVVDADPQLLESEVLRRAAQGVLLTVLWTLMGIAIGSVVHSQVAALVGTLIWVFLGETLLWGLLGLVDLDGVTSYLPFRALDSADGTNEADMLEYWPGVAVSLAWIAAIGAAGVARTVRRDLT